MKFLHALQRVDNGVGHVIAPGTVAVASVPNHPHLLLPIKLRTHAR